MPTKNPITAQVENQRQDLHEAAAVLGEIHHALRNHRPDQEADVAA
jgi:hypothetical protein